MTQETVPTNQIITAFGVGWHMAELYHADRVPGETEPEHADSLPGIGRLTQAERSHLLTLQVTAGLEQLGQGPCAKDKRDAIGVQVTATPLNPDALKQAVLAAHTTLLTTLTATDAAVGAAYGLGRALAETMLVPTTDEPATFADQFDIHRIRRLQTWLANLEGRFPGYAASVVSLTLDRWSNWVQTSGQVTGQPWDPDHKRRVGQSIRSQGDMWYGLLTGTIESTHLLGPDAYAAAAQSLTRRVGGMAGHFLIGTGIGRLLSALIIALGAVLTWVLVTGHLNVAAGTTAILLGTLGVTTGGVVSAIGRVLRLAQAPLWDAELTEGIAMAAAILPT